MEFDKSRVYTALNADELKWTELKIGDVIRSKTNLGLCYMITGMDYSKYTVAHIRAGDNWIEDKDLELWEKVEE